jgi:hypothetical protein
LSRFVFSLSTFFSVILFSLSFCCGLTHHNFTAWSWFVNFWNEFSALSFCGQGLFIKDLIDQILLGQAISAFDSEFGGNIAQLGNQLLIQLQNVVHRLSND